MKTNEIVLNPTAYRPDIDGLRAIAVLAVVFFHAFPTQLRGGFIGVDIFFVISGYLITSILVANLNNKTFTYKDFYSRRIRRLGPALLLVLVFSFFFGFFLLQINEFNQLKKHIIGGITFTSNLIFWREAGYFDYASDTKALLHLWSLGIEEQFYLIWPLLIYISFKFKQLNWVFCITCIITLSFVINIVLSYGDPVAGFFSLQARFWELAVGASLSVSRLHSPQTTANTDPIYYDHIKGILGAVAIALGFILISDQVVFPGWWSLLPVLGAALLISAGPKSLVNRHILSNNILVYIGLLSYPLYLWHWPLLSFARTLLSGAPSYAARVGLLLLAFLLAALTYHFVERPIRAKKTSKHVVAVIIGALLVILIAAAWPQATPSPKTGADQMTSKEAFESYYLPVDGLQTLRRFEGKFRHECNFYQVEKFYEGKATNIPKESIDVTCYTPDGISQQSVLIWGDSHAQMLNFGLSRHLPKAWQVFQVASSGCHPTVEPIDDSSTNYCLRSNWFAMKVIRENKIKVVVVAQSVDHDPVQMSKIAGKLEAMGVERIIFLGSTPRWTDYLPKIILRQLWPSPPERTFTGVDRDVIRRDILVKRNFKRSNNRVFVDVIDLFCNQQGCLTQVIGENGADLTSWDFGHLTQAASDYLAEKILVDAVTGRLN